MNEVAIKTLEVKKEELENKIVSGFLSDYEVLGNKSVIDELQNAISQLSGEVIASGELNYVNRGYTILCVGFKGKYVSGVKLDKYIGKEIKIIIQECKK